MRSVRLVSNFWLAMSTTSSRARTSSLASRLVSSTTSSRECSAESMPFHSSEENAIVDGEDAIQMLEGYHPVVIEGMGYYDPRDPLVVAKNICASLESHFAFNKPTKPLLVFVQGDPLSPRGISAITPLVAKSLTESKRGLVCLDTYIDPTHSRNADRDNVILEVSYSQLTEILRDVKKDARDIIEDNNEQQPTILNAIEDAIDAHIVRMNHEREKIGKPPVKDYFKQYALLQEVTKGALRILCSELTIVHTSADINPFSVTSFFRVGVDLGLYDPEMHMVAYTQQRGDSEILNFNAIDKR